MTNKSIGGIIIIVKERELIQMKLFRKYYVKKMVKQIDKSIKVKFGKRLECAPTERTIYVAFKTDKIDKMTFMAYVKEIDKKCKFNDLMLGILHEIGHIYTYDERDEEPYNRDVELLSKLFQEKMLTDRQLNEFYLRLPMESKATHWAVEFARLNKAFCKRYQAKIGND